MKAPIDLRRNSAGSMTVGLPEEGNITDLYTVGDDRLLMIKEEAVYEIKMADMIDPARLNPNIPNIQQRLLSEGSKSELVQSILITSGQLFDPSYLRNLNCPKIRDIALSATEELISMGRIATRTNVEISDLISALEGQKLKDGLIIPSLNDARQSTKNFLQRADHFCRELFYITREFEKGFGDLDNLLRKAKSEKPANDEFVNFLERSVPYLKFIRNARNAMEHPIPQKRIEIRNFELTEGAQIKPPSITVIHPKTPEPEANLSDFFLATVLSLKNLYGQWIAHLCARHAHFGGFSVGVMSTPKDRREALRSDYMYAVAINGKMQPVG
jgi:hypothetical protein